MKKILLLLIALMSINTFAQINVKEGSFRKIDGYLMLDKEDHRDDNWKPMALIKITAEGMKAEERARLEFHGNAATFIDVHQKGSQTYLYLTAQAATFLEIIHPDYGKTEYHFPEDLCGFCGYEMVVEYVPKTSEQTHGFIKNHAKYIYDIGEEYYYGKGVEQDYAKAVECYEQSADMGYADAQFRLGYFYFYEYYHENYNEMEKERINGLELLIKAANQGHVKAQDELGLIYLDGYGWVDEPIVGQDYTKALEYFTKAANQGYASAQTSLGYCYEKGYGVKQDYKKAVEYYKIAAEKGDAFGQYHLGDCYEKGYGVKRNYKEAVKYYTLSSDQGNINAIAALGTCYRYGKGVKKDLTIARELEKRCWELFDKERAESLIIQAKQGDLYCQNELGYCYLYGKGVQYDSEKAVEYFTMAADKGYKESQYELGVCYEKGRGVKQDKSKAIEWYKKAAAQGYEKAKTALKRLGA